MNKPPKPWSVFQERLFDAMAKQGIWTPAELARVVKVKPQTAYKWWRGQTKNLSAVDLFRLADALDVSARWLLGQKVSPARGVRPTADQERVLGIYKSLPQPWREDWVSDGVRTLERLTVPPTADNPYGRKR